jgi:hypothetical protein
MGKGDNMGLLDDIMEKLPEPDEPPAGTPPAAAAPAGSPPPGAREEPGKKKMNIYSDDFERRYGKKPEAEKK